MKKFFIEVIAEPIIWGVGICAVLAVIDLLARHSITWGIPIGIGCLVWLFKFVFGIAEVAGLNKKKDDDLF